MRFLILSDIHANMSGLDAALKASEGRWDRVACLGDIVGYGPDPNEVVDKIRELNAVTIRGNHDKAGSGLEDASDFNPVARSAAIWTHEELRPDNLDYLLNLPTGPVQIDGITLVHGALHDEDEYVFTQAQALDGLLDAPTPLTFFGHTHIQGGFILRGDTVEPIRLKVPLDAKFVEIPIEQGTNYLVNPGSIGQPRDGDPRAGFVIADLGSKKIEFWRITYDIAAVQERMYKAGLPEPLILRIAFGR
ncbi:MAG TPA: metallophosphoesterase family protein [Candidatus Acidoferrales bacterium]|nr:metallophosphoesterase family protein [Candidatus Acidoferrales bacterium]